MMEEIFYQSSVLDESLANSHESKWNLLIEEYLQNHHYKYNNNNSKYILDLLFESSSEWLNVTRPLVKENLSGKIIILDFFTYCCINCLHILPLLKRLEESNPEILILGIHSAKFSNERKSENLQDALSRISISHPVLNDGTRKVWSAFSITCWPTLLIFSSSGNLVKSFIGEDSIQRSLNAFVSFLTQKTQSVQSSSFSNSGTLLSHDQPLFFPGKITGLPEKNLLALSDTGHHRVLIFDYETERVLSIIGGLKSGSQNGDFSKASFNSPGGLVFESEFIVLVADTGNHLIRKIDLKNQIVSSIGGKGIRGSDLRGGNDGVNQEIASPMDVCLGLSPSGHRTLFIAMAGTHQIWGLSLESGASWWKRTPRMKSASNSKEEEEEDDSFREQGTLFRIAGNGKEENRNNSYAHKAGFAQPSGIAFGNDESLYIADSESSSIRKLNISSGAVSNVCGGSRDPTDLFSYDDIDGIGTKAQLQHPLGIDVSENIVYIADSYNHKIKKIHLDSKLCTSLDSHGLREPSDVLFFQSVLLVVDTNSHRILKMDPESGASLGTVNLDFSTLSSYSESNTYARRSERLLVSSLSPFVELALRLDSESPLNSEAVNEWTFKVPCDSKWPSNLQRNGVIPALEFTLTLFIEYPLPSNSISHLDLDLKVHTCDKDKCQAHSIHLSLYFDFENKVLPRQTLTLRL